MIERKTVLDVVEVRRDGATGVRLALLLVEGDEVLDSKWHRTVVDGEVSAESQMDEVNNHLATMNYPPVNAEDIATIKTYNDYDLDAKLALRRARMQG